jgi:hypothetical protein
MYNYKASYSKRLCCLQYLKLIFDGVFNMRLKTISAIALIFTFATSTAHAKPPAFWHWYHAYSQPLETCGMLLKEAMQNIQQNWDLDGGDINKYNASFVSGNTRGFMRCLKRNDNASWVVLITSGGGEKAKTMFQDMKVVVCGDC